MGFIESALMAMAISLCLFVDAQSKSVAVCHPQTAEVCHPQTAEANADASTGAMIILSLATTLNNRMEYMKDVAGDKYKKGKPVEDLPREEKVMNSAVANASAEGLDPNSVRPFIQAQMDVAKDIQRTYIAGWKVRPEKWEPRALEEVREFISADDAKILRLSRQQLTLGGFCEAYRAQIYRSLTAPHITDAHRKLLVDTLFCVTLKQ
ncbi:monofunctional chorismate mutase [Bemisia tabaci]|uniref:monofunctional chorismate mutase n=1 Tax=Bemisia tabaci TaxID=7038 RepID=UPI003B2839CE